MLRGYKRQIIGSLCIAACVFTLCLGLEGIQSLEKTVDAVYGERYRYDLSVRNIDEALYKQIDSTVTGIAHSETALLYAFSCGDKTVKLSTLSEDARLVVPTDANGTPLSPGDGILIDEMRAIENGLSVGDSVTIGGVTLPITGIARDIQVPYWYVSPATAEKLDGNGALIAYLELEEGTDPAEVKKQLNLLSRDAYFTELSKQKELLNHSMIPMRTVISAMAYIAFGIGSLLIFNMTILDFNENKLRYAILRAIGTPVFRLGIISVGQNLARVLIGVLIALPVCYIGISQLLWFLSSPSQQYVLTRYPLCLFISCLIPFTYILLGIGVSLYLIKKMNFCQYMNEVE